YDLLIEEAAEQQGIAVKSLTLDELPEATDAVSGAVADDVLRVIHVHGNVINPESIVLTPASYRQARERVKLFLPHLYKNRTICFLGTALDEIYLLELLASLRPISAVASHVLATDHENAKAIATRASVSQYTHGVLVEEFAAGEWHSLDDLAAVLALPGEPPSTDTVIALTSARRDEMYVDSVLVVVTDQTEPDLGDFADALLAEAGLRSRLTETQVAEFGRRTVIVGAPGSGKSLLLRRLGELAPAAESPVLIRLRTVEQTVGDPIDLLEQWVSLGESLREDPQPIGQDALDSERFHFLLDGLDECSPAVQERVAQAIVRVADAYPQHRFTIASRQVSVLELFPTEDWQRLSLQPGPEWSERFLSARGTSWPALLEAHPGLGDLRDLLRLPFFLRRVVEMAEAGALAEFQGVWDVVDRIVTDAISAAANELPAEALREWLRTIALAMQVAGRTSITLQELESVPLPESLARIGTAPEIVERLLATPLLVSHARDQFAFVHRLLAEGLVAEALLRLGPSEQLLTVVAPTVSDAISGLRLDWAVPVTLAAAQDERWRTAVGGRDSLAAAKATPSTGSEDARAQAAAEIWNTYAEWELWLFNPEGYDLLEPGETLVRLLRSGGLTEFEQSVVAGLDSSSPFIRVNALQVIGRAELNDLVSDARLASFIERDDNTVVRRYAAITAARLGRTALYDLITQRLLQTTEEVERQDLAHAARDLGTKQQLFDLALDMNPRDRLAALIVEQGLASTLPPKDRLRLLRSQAEHDTTPLTSDRERFNALVREIEADDETATAVAYVALAWTIRDDSLDALLAAYPRGAAVGLKQAVED
ncbi:MAG: hypothetical protein E6J20_19320, partial [Chloroflexi bacterium]